VETGEGLTSVKILPRDPHVLKGVVFGQIQGAFNCSGGYLALDAKLRSLRQVMLGNMMYGVVLIFFYGW